jgi:hypothetical protein
MLLRSFLKANANRSRRDLSMRNDQSAASRENVLNNQQTFVSNLADEGLPFEKEIPCPVKVLP